MFYRRETIANTPQIVEKTIQTEKSARQSNTYCFDVANRPVLAADLLTGMVRTAIFDQLGFLGREMYVTRLIASIVVSALLMAAIFQPTAPMRLAENAASLRPTPASLANRTCPLAGSLFTHPFADIGDVISVSPLGGVTAPGEPLPAPYIRINTRKGANQFERRQTSVTSPARAEIKAIERRILRRQDGRAKGQSWTVHFTVCEEVSFYLGDLDTVDPEIIRRAGGLAAFEEISGPDHVAATMDVRVRPGTQIGLADGFDVGVEDQRIAPKELIRPERYATSAYLTARVFDVPTQLIDAIATDHTRAQCPLDYFPTELQTAWTGMLGDAFGMRRAKGEDACRAALVDVAGTAQGAWFTDAANNAVATKVSAIALASDNVDPSRQILSLHGRLKSLTPDMVALTPKQRTAREAAAKDFLTFSQGQGLVNRHFADTLRRQMYCYEDLRANFVGPRIVGVILLQVTEDETGAPRMKLEARSDAMACADLQQPWAFTGAETTFYR